jgi:hypothetical protein
LHGTLERSVAPYINRQYTSLDETIIATNAASQMHSKRVETMIVTPKDSTLKNQGMKQIGFDVKLRVHTKKYFFKSTIDCISRLL